MRFYVAQLHAGHWYVCETTRETQAGYSVPWHLQHAYDTKAEAEAARVAANEALGSPTRELCKAILLEAGWHISRHDMADYYHHNRLGRAPLYSREKYAKLAVIR